MMKADMKVATAAGLSVYLPLYWMATRPESDGTPNPMTAGKVVALLLTFAVYLLTPFVLRLLSRYTLAARTPSWLSIPAVGSALLVMVGVAAMFVMRQPVTVEDTFMGWLVLSLWTMPASAWVYYFRPVVDLIKAWNRGPDYETLNFRQ